MAGAGPMVCCNGFGLLVWPPVPDFELVDRVPDQAAAERIERIFAYLDQSPLEDQIGGTSGGLDSAGVQPAVLRFDAEAQVLAAAAVSVRERVFRTTRSKPKNSA